MPEVESAIIIKDRVRAKLDNPFNAGKLKQLETKRKSKLDEAWAPSFEVCDGIENGSAALVVQSCRRRPDEHITPCSNECGELTMHGQLQEQSKAPSESAIVGDVPPSSVTTEARSEREKEVEEFMQRPVDPALLTASRGGACSSCASRQAGEDKEGAVSVFHIPCENET